MSDEFDQHYTDYQTNRSALRKWVRRAYLRSAARQLRGPTLDFGCGAGELLEKLPTGSKGLEYNLATVAHCKSIGLAVEAYDGFVDDWSLSVLEGDRFESMVVSHVLEHLHSPAKVLNKLLMASERLGVRRVLVIVPGQAGFKIDVTHLTFVDRAMLCDDAVVAGTGFVVDEAHYFPGNLRGIGDWFPHHELQVVYVRR
jgi:SAM-dependent methyltransferase